jgi:hypothetical protein
MKKPKQRFRLKRSKSTEAQLAEALKKAEKIHKKKMKKLSAHDQKVYLMMNDPSNQVMNQIRYGGDDALNLLLK